MKVPNQKRKGVTIIVKIKIRKIHNSRYTTEEGRENFNSQLVVTLTSERTNRIFTFKREHS